MEYRCGLDSAASEMGPIAVFCKHDDRDSDSKKAMDFSTA
jgi:hypothetical protein